MEVGLYNGRLFGVDGFWSTKSRRDAAVFGSSVSGLFGVLVRASAGAEKINLTTI